MADITTPHILSKPERQTVSTFLNYRPRQTRSSRFSVFLRTSTGSFDGEKKKEIDELREGEGYATLTSISIEREGSLLFGSRG